MLVPSGLIDTLKELQEELKKKNSKYQERTKEHKGTITKIHNAVGEFNSCWGVVSGELVSWKISQEKYCEYCTKRQGVNRVPVGKKTERERKFSEKFPKLAKSTVWEPYKIQPSEIKRKPHLSAECPTSIPWGIDLSCSAPLVEVNLSHFRSAQVWTKELPWCRRRCRSKRRERGRVHETGSCSCHCVHVRCVPRWVATMHALSSCDMGTRRHCYIPHQKLLF